MNGCIHISRNNTEEVGEIIRALSLHYYIYIDQSERNTITIQYYSAEENDVEKVRDE